MEESTLSALRSAFGDRLQENVPLSGYTTARIGGPADALLFVYSAEQLAQAAGWLWNTKVPFVLLGGGANVLVSDKGLRGVAIINRARLVKFDLHSQRPSVWAESGVTLNDITQRAARLGLTGFEWAGGIPGSLGGAVYGNAGAFGGEMSRKLVSVDLVLHPGEHVTWPVEKMGYGYRSSLLKREHPAAIILSARLGLQRGDPQAIQAMLKDYSARRKSNQPPGASMGSMFKNPAGDKAGRLIEAAGLKGTRIGNAEISPQHGNFFINHGQSDAKDMKALIELAQNTVHEKFGIRLELEIELVGEWD